jgi:hypothetical protein
VDATFPAETMMWITAQIWKLRALWHQQLTPSVNLSTSREPNAILASGEMATAAVTMTMKKEHKHEERINRWCNHP